MKPPGRLPPAIYHTGKLRVLPLRRILDSECLEVKNDWEKCWNESKSGTWPGKQRQSHLKEVALFYSAVKHAIVKIHPVRDSALTP